MLYLLLAAALVGLASLAFWKFPPRGRWDIPESPERPGNTEHKAALSEIFPDLQKDDLLWLRDTGGYKGYRLYPRKRNGWR